MIQTDWNGRPVGTNPYSSPVPQHEIPPRVLRHFPIGVGEHDNDPGEVINHYQPGVYGYHANDEDEDEDEEDPEDESNPPIVPVSGVSIDEDLTYPAVGVFRKNRTVEKNRSEPKTVTFIGSVNRTVKC